METLVPFVVDDGEVVNVGGDLSAPPGEPFGDFFVVGVVGEPDVEDVVPFGEEFGDEEEAGDVGFEEVFPFEDVFEGCEVLVLWVDFEVFAEVAAEAGEEVVAEADVEFGA